MEIEIDKPDIIYNISQAIIHHKNSVRSLSCNSQGLLATASFDKTVAIFKQEEGKYVLHRETSYHQDYVYVVRAEMKDKGFFTGSKDKKIIFMDNDGSPLKEFDGHTKVVNSISQSEENYFISGSWDNTAKVWNFNTGECLYTLEDHLYAVTTLALKNHKFITASQDKKIKFWDKNQLIKTINNAHEDIIRDMKVGSNCFYSCSNDQIIKKWSMDGTEMASYSGHEGFVFSIFPLHEHWLFSGGDDRFVRTWIDGENKQCLIHPNTIWDVCVDSRNQLITACADGVIRVFSKNENDWFNKDQISDYEKICFDALNQGQENSGDQVDVSTLITLQDGLKLVGKEGEIRIFNNKGTAEAYCYKSDIRTWQKIGDVLGKKDNKKYYAGDKAFKAGEYDYIFDVDLEGRTSVIPFNKGDNCLVSAEKFVAREGLHKGYLDEIARWLRKQSGGSEGLTQTSQSKSGPTKTENKTVKNQVYQSDKIKFPKINYIKFDTVNIEGPLKKTLEFNSKFDNSSNYFMTDNELKLIKSLLETIKNFQFYHTSSFSENELNVFHKKLGYFPEEFIIPYLDSFRMFLLHPRSQDMFKKMGGGIQEYTRLIELLKSTSNNSVRTLILRIFANLFLHEATRNLLSSKRGEIFDVLANFIDSDTKLVKSSLIAVFYNYTVLIYDKIDSETCLQILSLLNEVLINEKDIKNINNILFSFGNLLFSNDKNRSIAKDMSLLTNINEIIIDKDADNADKNICNELKAFLAKILI